jgi:heterodisulfide reductase subunit A-like polyferredoxin
LTQALARSPYRAVIDGELCMGCGTCADSCNFEAIELESADGDSDLKAAIDEEKCWGCGVCVDLCDQGSISLERASTPGEKPENMPNFLGRWRSIGEAQSW